MMKFTQWLTERLPMKTNHGWCDTAKAQAIYHALPEGPEQQPTNGVEIGVFGGKSLLAAAFAIRDSKAGGAIVGIDPYTADTAKEFPGGDPANDNWWQKIDYALIRRACEREINITALGEFAKLRIAKAHEVASEFKELTYLHLDGWHAEKAVARDMDAYLPLVVAGGIIVLDDIGWAGVEKNADRVRSVGDFVAGGESWEIWRRR